MSTRVNEDRVRQWWSLRTTSVVRGQFVFFIRLTFRRDTTFQVPFHLESGGFVCAILYLVGRPKPWQQKWIKIPSRNVVGDHGPSFLDLGGSNGQDTTTGREHAC